MLHAPCHEVVPLDAGLCPYQRMVGHLRCYLYAVGDGMQDDTVVIRGEKHVVAAAEHHPLLVPANHVGEDGAQVFRRFVFDELAARGLHSETVSPRKRFIFKVAYHIRKCR